MVSSSWETGWMIEGFQFQPTQYTRFVYCCSDGHFVLFPLEVFILGPLLSDKLYNSIAL